MKRCIACGMPMEKPGDYPNGDSRLAYCIHCARPDGSMQAFDEKRAGLAAFLMRTQGLEQTVAGRMALDMMARLPAWQAHFTGEEEPQ